MPELRYEITYWDETEQLGRTYGSATDVSGAAALVASLKVQPIDARHIAIRDLKDKRVVECRSCRAPMIWLKTKAGKNCPCDVESVGPEDIEYDAQKHKSHFATCPHAAQHRRPR